MNSPSHPVFVVGRFPPPLDGQTLATERLADLVAGARPTVRVSTSAPDANRLVTTEARWGWYRFAHYLGIGGRLRRRLAAHPNAVALWTSISPHPLGHARDVLTTLPAFGARRPVVAVVHRAYFDRMFRSAVTRATARRVVSRCDAFVFLTEGLSERAARFVPTTKRFVIPNTVGTDVLCTEEDVAVAQAARLARPTLRLLFLGHLMPEKGYLDALDAATRLHHEGLPVDIDFVGRWMAEADPDEFHKRARRSGLGDRVRVHGGVTDRDEIKRFLLDADVLVFPSTHPSEALPVAVLEALNAGTPVVGVRHSGLPEIVRDGVEGYVVPPHDGDALASALRRFTERETWSAASHAARRRFVEAYGPRPVQAAWLSLLDRVETPSAP